MSRRLLFVFALILSLIAIPAASVFAGVGFETWLAGVRAEASSQGISEDILNTALSGIEFKPRIIELDRKQPEGKLSFARYSKNVLTPERIRTGRALYRKHKALLERVSAHYGVQPQYIVALWGIETSYGANTGGFNVVEALATLAYDGRRAEFFREELLQALKILEEGHVSPQKMRGSWAGAMGQNQFMPSSFFKFAVDGNQDGQIDIWASLPDVFSSTAHYLSSSGWKGDERWGRSVVLPHGFPAALLKGNPEKPLKDWRALGLKTPGGAGLPGDPAFKATLVAPDGVDGRAFLVYNNFQTILEWNRSTYFALSVGLLADAIAS